VVTVGRIPDLAARRFDAFPDRGAELDEMAEGVCRDLVEILKDQLAHVAVEQGLRRHMARARSLVDLVGDDQEDLRLGNAAGHRMGEENIATVSDHAVQDGHDLRQRIREPCGSQRLASFDVVPLELVMLPAFQRHAGQEVGRGGATRRRVEIEAGHQRNVDDPSTQSGFRFRKLVFGKGAQCVVLVAPSDRDADDLHSGFPGLVEQAGRVAASEQFAEQNEDIAFAEHGVLGDVFQCDRVFHGLRSSQKGRRALNPTVVDDYLNPVASNVKSFKVTEYIET
jgi:hypothetical protein